MRAPGQQLGMGAQSAHKSSAACSASESSNGYMAPQSEASHFKTYLCIGRCREGKRFSLELHSYNSSLQCHLNKQLASSHTRYLQSGVAARKHVTSIINPG